MIFENLKNLKFSNFEIGQWHLVGFFFFRKMIFI